MEGYPTDNMVRGRIAEHYKHSIIQSIEHDEHHPGTWSNEEARSCKPLQDQYFERGRQLDENEDAAKEQYDSNHCESATGLSSDDYRHWVVEDCTQEQMKGQSASESQREDFWSDSVQGGNASAENQNEQVDYWTENAENNSAAVADANEQENALESEASC